MLCVSLIWLHAVVIQFRMKPRAASQRGPPCQQTAIMEKNGRMHGKQIFNMLPFLKHRI